MTGVLEQVRGKKSPTTTPATDGAASTVTFRSAASAALAAAGIGMKGLRTCVSSWLGRVVTDNLANGSTSSIIGPIAKIGAIAGQVLWEEVVARGAASSV